MMRNARTRITHGSPRLFWSTVRPLRPPPLTAAYVLHSETLAVYSAADFLTCRSDVILFVNDVHFRIKSYLYQYGGLISSELIHEKMRTGCYFHEIDILR